MDNGSNNKKTCVHVIIKGEPVKLIRDELKRLSAILYYENPSIEYLESKYIRYSSGEGLFFVNKINLN